MVKRWEASQGCNFQFLDMSFKKRKRKRLVPPSAADTVVFLLGLPNPESGLGLGNIDFSPLDSSCDILTFCLTLITVAQSFTPILSA